MKKLLPFALFVSFSFCLSPLSAQIISTVAGNGVQGFSGDNGPATAAEFYYPNAVGFDRTGIMYVADENYGRIRKVDLSGIITTICGTGTSGYSGDGGPATAAQINAPEDVKTDMHGNIYIADLLNYRIRKINTSGIISTFAGSGTNGYSGDGGQATAAKLSFPYRLAIDTSGNVYIADQGNNRIRMVNTSGVITTVAGTGTATFSGDGGQATNAGINDPQGLALDAAGNLYIGDQNNHRVRIVSTSGVINTFAGDGTSGFAGDGGQATAAQIAGAWGVATDAFGNLYINDMGNNRIRMVDASGVISTFAGDGAAGYNGDGIPATNAELNDAWDVSTDPSGNVYIADEVNERVRMVPGNPLSVKSPVNNLAVTVYPNPNNGMFTLQVNGGKWLENSTIEIYNALGEKVYSELSATNYTLPINLSGQSAGIYFYRVLGRDNKIAVTGKFVIE